MAEFSINILPFNILSDNVMVAISKFEKRGYSRILKENFPINHQKKEIEKFDTFLWWNFFPEGDDLSVQVSLNENKAFAKKYLNKAIYIHFTKEKILTSVNFIDDVCVYIEDSSFDSNKEYKKYNEFVLKIDQNSLMEGLCLLVSYSGDSFILKKSLQEQNIPEEHLGKVKLRNQINKFQYLHDEEKNKTREIFPIINSDIQAFLNLPNERNYSDNRYKKYYEKISQFYNEYLSGKIIGNNIEILKSGFIKPHQEKINQTSEGSNLLLFGNNNTHFVPYTGLKEYGPLKPLSNTNVKIIFIFHKDDKDYANKIYSYLKNGYKSFPGLESFVKINFEVDTTRSIKFENENPENEIELILQKYQLDPDKIFKPTETYIAIYISRIKENSEDEEDDLVYFHLKETLLHYGITSQVIYREKVNDPSFNYYLPNISIALLAKLGGIPWRLYRPIKNDLIIGIGMYRSIKGTKNYIGSAFCFKNDGKFQGFNVYEEENTFSLAELIKKAIEEFLKENNGIERLVIHYYKKISRKEEEPIQKVLNHMKLSVPYVVLTINDAFMDGYVLFDNLFEGKMPQSGTFIKIRHNEFILCNNTRYSNKTNTKIEGFPLPIKIKMKSNQFENLEDKNVVRDLIDQVYQFSRMYWKSVRQQHKPVTILYAEIVAGMIANFKNKQLEPFAQKTLWFL